MRVKRAIKKSTGDKLVNWNEYYVSKPFGIGIECTSCKKWRLVYEYEETHEVPEDWECSMSIIDKQKGHCDLPTIYDSDYFLEEVYVPGSIVWAKCRSYPWWPAMVEDDPDCEEFHVTGEAEEDEEYHVVFFYQPAMRAWIKLKDLTAFAEPPSNAKCKRSLKKKLENAEKIASTAASMKIEDRLKDFSFAVRSKKKFPQSKTNIIVPKIPKRKREGNNTANNLPIKKRKTGEAYGDDIPSTSTQPHKMSRRNLGRKPSRALIHNAQDTQIFDELVPAISSLAIAAVNPPQSTEDPSFAVPIAANPGPSFAVPIAANPGPSFAVPIAANPGPSFAVPIGANPGPSFAVPIGANPDPSFAVPIGANPDPSCDVPVAANVDTPVASHSGQQNGQLSDNDHHEEAMDTQSVAAGSASVTSKVSVSFTPYPLPNILKFKRIHELFSDVDSNESSLGTEKVKKAKVETVVETPPEEDEIWIETNEECYLDVLTEAELNEIKEERNLTGILFIRRGEISPEDEEVVDLNHPYHPVHEYIKYPN